MARVSYMTDLPLPQTRNQASLYTSSPWDIQSGVKAPGSITYYTREILRTLQSMEPSMH